MIVRQANFCRRSLIQHESIINNILPDSLMIEVLLRLPEAKFVIRCELVCRDWYRIISAEISTSRFVSRYLNHHHVNSCERISHFVSQSHWQSEYFPLFLRSIIDGVISVNVIASFNDLILCRLRYFETDQQQDYYCVCNPLTRKYTNLPPTPPNQIIRGKAVIVGFQCDPYICYNNNNNNTISIDPHYNYRVAFVYLWREMEYDRKVMVREFSSETNEWHDCSVDMPDPSPYEMNKYLESMENMIFHKGIGFWLNVRRSNICIYNPGQKIPILRTIGIPPRDSYLGSPVIGVCGGFLRYFTLTKSSLSSGVFVDVFAKVWELKDGGEWDLVHNASLDQMGDPWRVGLKKGFRGIRISALAVDPYDSDIVYIYASIHRRIISCNLRDMEMKLLQSCSLRSPPGAIKYKAFPVMAPLWPTPLA